MSYIDTKYLWHSDWYDGPLEGACEYQGRIYWYVIFDSVEYINGGNTFKKDKYKIYYISDEDIIHQTYWHELEEKFYNVLSPYRDIATRYFNHLYRLGRKEPNIDINNPVGFTHF